MTAHNSTNNNVAFFFVSDLKIVFSTNYYFLIPMSWTGEEKYLALEIKSFKTVQAKFRKMFNFYNYFQKT